MVRHTLSRRLMLRRTGAAAALLGFAPWVRAGETGPPPLAAYGRLPAIGKVALSPSGKRAALVVTSDGVMAINDVDLATGDVATGRVEHANAVPVMFWADGDSVFFVTSHTNQSVGQRFESWSGFIADIRNSKRYQLYRDMTEYGPNLAGDFHRVKRNGTYFVTASNFRVTSANYEVDASTALYAFSTSDERAFRIDEDTRHILDWAIDGAGQAVARSEYDDRRHLWRLRYKGAKGWNVVWEIGGDLDLPALKGVGRDGRSVVLAMGSGEYADSYVEVDEHGAFGTPLVHNRSRYTPLFSPVSNGLIGFSSETGVDDYIFYDDAHAGLPALVRKAVGDMRADIVDIAENPMQVAVFTEGAGNPGSYFSIDFGTGTVKPLGDTYPDLPAQWVSAKQRVTYKAGDGLDIEAFITLPMNRPGKACPTVVLVHGGPESYDDGRFDWTAQALASRGYLVFQANFRGSAGHGGDFVARGYGEWGRKMQTDLSDGVAWVVAQGLADPKRVAIVGASYGGYAALAGVALQDGIYNCAVAMSGMSDVRGFMADTMKAAGYNPDARSVLYWKRYLGDESGWDAISPLPHAASVNVPVLLIHGKDDAVVAIEESYAMRDALQRAGKTVEMVLLQDEDHYLSKEPTRIQTLEAVVAFLAKYNPA